jgi:hypothetical protein
VIASPTEARLEVVRGDDPERANRCDYPALTAVETVVAAANADRLPPRAGREIDVTDGDITRVSRSPIRSSRGVLAVSATTQVGPSVVTVM